MFCIVILNLLVLLRALVNNVMHYIISRPHALIINQKKCFFLYFTLAAVLAYDYQRSLRKVQTRMFITTLVIHCSTVHDPSALKDGLHRLYRWGITCSGSACCMAGLPVPE